MSASTVAFHRCASEVSSITSRQARRRPSFVGCQPRRAGIGSSEMPPPERTVSCAAPPSWLRTRRPAGSARSRPAAADSTASAAPSLSSPDAVGEPADEAAAHEDDAPVGRNVDRGVAAEDLEAPETLVEVDVGDPVVAARVPARHEQVGDVSARDAERGRVRPHMAERDIERIGGRGCLCEPDSGVVRGHGARHEHERHERGDEDQNQPWWPAGHGFLPLLPGTCIPGARQD